MIRERERERERESGGREGWSFEAVLKIECVIGENEVSLANFIIRFEPTQSADGTVSSFVGTHERSTEE